MIRRRTHCYGMYASSPAQRRSMVESTPLQVKYTCRRSVTTLGVTGHYTGDSRATKKEEQHGDA